MIDFVTILFNDELEINLMKLQAYSMRFVDFSLINNIYVVWNDRNPEAVNFEALVKWYPQELQSKVFLVSQEDLGMRDQESTWFNQQIAKLYSAKVCKAEYFVMLDAKNHFTRHVDKSLFFRDGLPILIKGSIYGVETFVQNSLNYFGLPPQDTYFQCITPFLFKTEYVLDLIEHVEIKEKASLDDIFRRRKVAEFALYTSYLIYANKIDEFVVTQDCGLLR